MTRFRSFAILLTAAALAACVRQTASGGGTTPDARASIVDSTGAVIGEATFRQAQPGVAIRVEVQGLAPGAHGVHLHAVGRCDRPEFTSAEAHINPDGHQHGVKNPAGPHAGDLPNIILESGRTSQYSATTLRVTLDAGTAGLFDADGSTIVIHAAPDDDMTDPAGNSGARLACGVVERTR